MPIVSGNTDLRYLVIDGNDGDFAEPVLLAYLAGNVSDPNRENEKIEAILSVGKERTMPLSGSRGQAWQSDLAAGEAELHISRLMYPSMLLKVGDKVRALARAGKPWFEVVSINDRAQPRIIVRLNEA